MTLLWLVAAFAVPFVIGSGVLTVIYGKTEKTTPGADTLTRMDGLIVGWLSCIGIGEIVHLAGVFLDQPLSALVTWDVTLTALVTAAALGILAVKRRKLSGSRAEQKIWRRSARYLSFCGLCAVAAIVTLVSIYSSDAVYLTGDMTAETVESFRTTDALYSVNPMTGQAYQGGIPSRLEILCLPTLYAIACELTGLETTELVWRWIPVLVLVGCLTAYASLAGYLFPDRTEDGAEQREQAACRRVLFLLLVLVILWLGNSGCGMDGFDLLNSGFRAVSIRGAVLVPYTIACALRRRLLPTLLCVAAEACVMWTLYGLGTAVLVAVGMWLIGKWREKHNAEEPEC